MWEEQLRGFEQSSQFHARLPLVKTARHPRNTTEKPSTSSSTCSLFATFFWDSFGALMKSFWVVEQQLIYSDLWSSTLLLILDLDSWIRSLILVLDPGAMLSWAVFASSCESWRSSGIIRWNWIHSNPKNKRFESNSLLLTWILLQSQFLLISIVVKNWYNISFLLNWMDEP